MKKETQTVELAKRRELLGAIGSLVGAAALAACGGSSSTGSTTTTTTTATTATPTPTPTSTSTSTPTPTSTTCSVTPEGEIGPYFADDSASGFKRSNILSNLDGSDTQSGIPLALTVTVLDGDNGCVLMSGVQVDIWHCNASGVYSDIAGESTTGQTWLRGYQITGTDGQVVFNTIIPGWYQGRTTHIHLRLRSSYSEASSTSDGTNTTQLFFAQSFIDTLDTSVAPYSSEGVNNTTNAGDRVYADQTEGANLLTLTGDNTNGYSSAVTITLPITS